MPASCRCLQAPVAASGPPCHHKKRADGSLAVAHCQLFFMHLVASVADAHGPSVTVSSLACHLDHVYSGALDGSLCTWHVAAEPGSPTALVPEHRAETVHPLGIVSLLAGPRGVYLASHSIEASQLMLHRPVAYPEEGRERGEMQRAAVPISPIHSYCLALCAETDEIWMGGLGPVLGILSHPGEPQPSSRKTTLELPAHPMAPPIQHIQCLAVTSSLVALSTESHAILLYDRKKNTWLPAALHEHTRPIRTLSFHSCRGDCYLWSSGEDGRVHLHQLLPTSGEASAWQVHYRLGWNAHADWITRMLFLDEEELLLTASSSGQLTAWRLSLPLPLSQPQSPASPSAQPLALVPESLTLKDVPGEGPIWALCRGPGERRVCVARGSCLSLYQLASI